MLKRFIKYVEENGLFAPGDTILAGVSGGVDSVVMLDLLVKAGYSVGIAHCNFKLRADESDAEEGFVERLALKYDKPLHKIAFETGKYAREKGVSIEMAARELRYKWFEEIRSKHNYAWISVAHHRDDQLETFFLNLARGTGLPGLTGMRPVNGNVVRPLLFASRKEIEKYCLENSLEFREDSSNVDTGILRNKIRHKILPLMEELNPSFRESLVKTMGNLYDSQKIESKSVKEAWDLLADQVGKDYHLSIDGLKRLNPLPSYLFQFLKPFHFNRDVVNEIVLSLVSGPGKQFLSNTHRLVRDRDYLIIRELGSEDMSIHYLDETCSELNYPLKMKVAVIERRYKFQIPDSPRIGCIDIGKIQFPLILRHWKAGDCFKPLGMNGTKKLSDFFVDLKLSLPEKENTWILANGEEIVWVIGRRLDDRYKITSKTKNILKMELI